MEKTKLSILESNSNNKIFNAKTNRWIKNTSTNRHRLQKQNESLLVKSKSKVLPKNSKLLQLKSPGKDVARPTIKPQLNTMKIKKKTKKKSPPKSLSKSLSKSPPRYMPIKDYGDYRLEDFSGDNVLSMLYGDSPQYDTYSEYLYESGITTDACSQYNKIPMIDLNLISKSEIHEGGINYLSEDGIIELPVKTFISEGGFGKVYEYSQELPLGKDDKYAVALKTYKEDDDPEIKIIRDINKTEKTNLCETVNARIIRLYDTDTNMMKWVAVMDLMDGTIYDLVKKKLPIREVLEIILKLADTLECLNKLGKVYTDLKSANVLYKCYKNKKLKVSLGDLGGICNKGGSEVSTYPAPEFTFPQFKGNCQESNMVWGLGIILLELLGVNTVDTFLWNTTEGPPWDRKFKNRKEFIEGINIEISNILKNITDPIVTELISEIFLNPKRITIKKIIELLKKL